MQTPFSPNAGRAPTLTESSNDHNLHGGENYFAARPKSHQSEPSMESRMTLTELFLTENEKVSERGTITREQLAHFIDLTYVATVFNINHMINGCGDKSSDIVLLSMSYFFILFTSRYHFDIYSIMFYSVDLVHRALFLAFNLGVFVMTYNIKVTPMNGAHRLLGATDPTDDHGGYSGGGSSSTTSGGYEHGSYAAGECNIDITYLQGFASGYLASRLTLILMYSLLIYFAHVNSELNSKRTYIVKVIPLFIGTVVMLPIYWDTVNPVEILFAVAVIEILGDIVPEVTNHYMQKYNRNIANFTISMRPDVDHLQDRLQEFFLIVLGESMIGLLIFHYDANKPRASNIATLFSFTLLFSLGSHFLVCVHRSAEQVHAMKKKNALIRIVYIWLHPVICYALLFATNALVQLVYKVSVTDGYSSVDSAKRLRRIMSVGLCVVVLLMVLMRIMHKGVVDHLRTSGRKMHVMYKICVAGMHLSLYWIVHDNLRFLLAQSFLTTSTNMVEMLIPMYSKSRAVNILFHRTTVDAENVPGAQKELNANRKSIVGKLSEHRTHGHEHGHGNGRSVNGSSSHALLELQTTSSPQQRQHKHQHHASSPSVSPVPAPSSPADIHNALHPTNLNTHGASDSDGNGERDERNGAEASSAAAVATPITEV